MIYLTNIGNKIIQLIIPENIQKIDDKILIKTSEIEDKYNQYYNRIINPLSREDFIYYIFRIPTRN